MTTILLMGTKFSRISEDLSKVGHNCVSCATPKTEQEIEDILNSCDPSLVLIDSASLKYCKYFKLLPVVAVLGRQELSKQAYMLGCIDTVVRGQELSKKLAKYIKLGEMYKACTKLANKL